MVIYTVEYYTAIQNVIIKSAGKWMELGKITNVTFKHNLQPATELIWTGRQTVDLMKNEKEEKNGLNGLN